VKNKDGNLMEFYAFEQHKYYRIPLNLEMYKL
jgi:hypothetical protein